jgi:hypothetical protein
MIGASMAKDVYSILVRLSKGASLRIRNSYG